MAAFSAPQATREMESQEETSDGRTAGAESGSSGARYRRDPGRECEADYAEGQQHAFDVIEGLGLGVVMGSEEDFSTHGSGGFDDDLQRVLGRTRLDVVEATGQRGERQPGAQTCGGRRTSMAPPGPHEDRDAGGQEERRCDFRPPRGAREGHGFRLEASFPQQRLEGDASALQALGRIALEVEASEPGLGPRLARWNERGKLRLLLHDLLPTKLEAGVRTWQKNGILAAASSMLALGAVEGVLRLVWQPGGQQSVIRAHPTYGWCLRPGTAMHSVHSERGLDYHIRVNALGHRDVEHTLRPAPGVRRVLWLGDSMLFGAGVEQRARVTDLLQERFGGGIEFLNSAVSGWGTDQEYLYLAQEGFGFEPDVVVLAICMLNDVLNNSLDHELFGTTPKPRFHFDDGLLQLEPPAPHPSNALRQRLRHSLKRSRLLHFAGRHLQQLHRPHPRPAAAPGIPAPYYPEDLESDRSHWSVYRKQYTPAFEAAFEVTEALLSAIADSCASRGIPLVLFAWPQKVEVDAAARDGELSYHGYQAEWFDLAAPYVRLERWAESRSVPFVYPLPAWRAAGTRLFFERDGHPNAAGHALAAAAVEPVLRVVLEEHPAHSMAHR